MMGSIKSLNDHWNKARAVTQSGTGCQR